MKEQVVRGGGENRTDPATEGGRGRSRQGSEEMGKSREGKINNGRENVKTRIKKIQLTKERRWKNLEWEKVRQSYQLNKLERKICEGKDKSGSREEKVRQ